MDGSTLHDDCSCPMGDGCKHCVATIMTARTDGVLSRPTIPARPAPDWRHALAGLEDDDDVVWADDTDLALQVSVRQPRTDRYAASDERQLMVRPMRRGKNGKWIKTGASWSDIASPYARPGAAVDPLQRAALRALMASARIEYYSNDQTVPFNQFGPDLWYQLERAIEVGVQLIGEHPTTKVELSAVPARATIDLTADDTGAVHLTTAFTRDDQPLPLDDDIGLLGAPPHGLWIGGRDHVLLVPFATPLHPAVARLAARGALTVPADEVDELLDAYQPALARHATVGSSDGSVTITTNAFDGLVLVVRRTALDAVALEWHVRYRRGSRTTLHRLHGPMTRSRDGAAERAAIAALELPTHLIAGLADAMGRPRDLALRGPDAIVMLTDVVPWFEARDDVDVEVHDDQPTLREATEDPLISLTVADAADATGERAANDWFDLGVEVSVDGQVIDFATLFMALDRGDELLILPSGTWLRLDRPDLARLRALIREARGLADPTADGATRINRFQLSWWDELTALGVVAEQSARWSDDVARLSALAAPEPVAPPSRLQASLRHYQQDGLDWLAFLHRNRLGGILADDMGLGKTVQALALCLHVLEAQPDARFLVVAPTSVVENWAREVARFAPDVTVCAVRETHTRRGTTLVDEIGDASIVVTSYALFRIEYDDYAAQAWEALFVDEAQFVKNHQGKTYQCVRRLDVATKVAMTGTPLENTLMDLWSLLSITAPGLYPDPKRFSDTYRKPIEAGNAPELLATLQRRIAPLMRRRTKSAVLTELPPKTEQIVEVELSARHAKIYQTQLQRERQKVLGLVGDMQKNRFTIFTSLTLLRQLALDPGLVDDTHDTVGSAKLDRLLDDLTQVIAEGHRALVFSQFTRYLKRVRARLDDAGIGHSYLDGRTRKRGEAIARFKDGEVPVFVVSLKAGGFGLNLTEADYCFVLDPWWNPAVEAQAVDRTHRIGQQNPVMVYRYVSTGTIEEKVVELQARKADLFATVMDNEGALSGALTEDDIRGLLDLS